MATATPTPPIPVFLLKTKSSPTDAYEDLLSASNKAGSFEPIFVPVLEHCFVNDGVAELRDLIVRRQISNGRLGSDSSGRYGGLIFTSQRAVEAFSKIVKGGEGPPQEYAKTSWPHLQNVPVYSVGPATTRALRAVEQQPPLRVSGEHTGNGEDLAYYIQEDYAGWKTPEAAAVGAPTSADSSPVEPKTTAPTLTLPPLLFVVGEKRRDIIPKVLMGDGSEAGAPRIRVDEIVVYGTGVMPSFPDDFQQELDATKERAVRWVIVFSPTGCDSMLRALGILDPETGKAREIPGGRPRTVFIATIGPTTRSYLQDTFGFDPDVCADEPSPDGVLRGISRFMASRAAN
ncbi:uroporphyrinogen-III synthase [Sporothrix eucalyptigena]|uniref:Uroporphyrinogen-III synthase n=1 Tax=Sporothrix eucalyptigena TaxID=1812306 RepID=A0ABP0CV07_9PEZI